MGEGHSKKLTFLSPPIASKHLLFPLTRVSASKVPVILKKFVLKEAQNLTLDATILKLYLAARLWLNVCDHSIQLKIDRKQKNLQLTWHPSQGQQNVFFQLTIHFTIFRVWNTFGLK